MAKIGIITDLQSEILRQMFVQRKCEAGIHTYIEVTQTTFPDTGAKKWLQCKYCGHINPLPEVNPFEDIT